MNCKIYLKLEILLTELFLDVPSFQEIEKDQAMEILAGGSLEIRSSSIYKTPASFTPRSGSFTPPSDSFTPPAGSFGKEFFGGGMSRQFGRSRYDGYKEGSDSAGTSDTDQPAKVGRLLLN